MAKRIGIVGSEGAKFTPVLEILRQLPLVFFIIAMIGLGLAVFIASIALPLRWLGLL